MSKPNLETPAAEPRASLRRRTVMDTAQRLGLLRGENGRIGIEHYAGKLAAPPWQGFM
jgi:hypothetical protein